MTDLPNQDRFTFNAYDLFANFLPGALLLFGIGLPFFVGQDLIPDLDLMEAIAATILSFAIGLGAQSVGSGMSKKKVFSRNPFEERERPFNEKIEKMLKAEKQDSDLAEDERFSNIDWAARELCIETFNLDCDGKDDVGQVFKSLLSYLESSNWSRGLRIQSLHLASRGIYIVCLALFAYYILFTIGLFIPIDTRVPTLFAYNGPLTWGHFLLLAIGMIPLSWIFFLRARHFESDVAVYILSEFYMSQYNWDEIDANDLDVIGNDVRSDQEPGTQDDGDEDDTTDF